MQPQQYLSDSKKKSNGQIIKRARSVTNAITCDRPAPKIAITLHDANTKDLIGSFEATPDTGAEATLAGIDILEKMCLDVDNLLPPPSEVLVAANGQELDCVGTLHCVIHYCDRQCVENVYICANVESFLLAWYTCISLAILPCDYPRPIDCSQKKSMPQVQITARSKKTPDGKFCVSSQPAEEEIKKLKVKLLEDYSDVFSTEGKLREMEGKKRKISLKEEAKHFALTAPRQIPFAYRE